MHPAGRTRVQFFKEFVLDLDGGSGYLGSFSLRVEGDD